MALQEWRTPVEIERLRIKRVRRLIGLVLIIVIVLWFFARS